MRNHKQMKFLVLIGFLSIMLGCARTPPTAGPEEDAESVASDGSQPASVELAEGPDGESGFEGTARPGIADESEAEISAALETEEVFQELLVLQPATAKVGIESIIGPDTRQRVNPTTTYPARAAVLITFTGGRCSGWLYGKDIVGTAGHCVHSGGPGGSWKQNVRVFPGRNGNSSPYGSCTAKRLYSVKGWTNSSKERYDYGAVKLNCNVGNTVGWFGYWWQSASLQNKSTTINGYPGDKPLEQWKSSDRVRVSQNRQVFYQNDTLGGMSGSGVYQVRSSGSSFCSGRCVMGIHAYGLHGSSPHSTNNHGTRITKVRFKNLKSWKNAN